MSNTKFLFKAYECKTDPIERMKYICTYILSGLHRSVYASKSKPPFNSVLGETYQAKNDDGCMIYMEQTVHHPPTLNYQLIAPNKIFEISGFGEVKVQIEGINKVNGWREGKNILKMDDGSIYYYNNLKARVNGVIMGERVYNFYDNLIIEDTINDLKCVVSFQPEINKGMMSMFRSTTEEIQYDEANIEISKINKETKEEQSLIKGYGSWIGQIYFEDKCYWSVLDEQQSWNRNDLNIIPSDGKLREDLNYILTGDIDNAQKEKERIEDIQRKDQKLREMNKKQSESK